MKLSKDCIPMSLRESVFESLNNLCDDDPRGYPEEHRAMSDQEESQSIIDKTDVAECSDASKNPDELLSQVTAAVRAWRDHAGFPLRVERHGPRQEAAVPQVTTKKALLEQALLGEGCLGKAADDEPVFLLRAQDMIADSAVEHWANMVAARSPHGSTQKVKDAYATVQAMRAWPTRKLPD